MSKVFISYAREDEAVAERLYKDLKNAGADPWLDKHDLFPGQGWRGAIKQALRQSSHFLCLISRNSARKRGYAQREIREALQFLKEIPPDEIYIIPVRLDETETPYEELQELNWVDLFPSYPKGLKKICDALKHSGGLDTRIDSSSGAQDRDAERIRAYRQLFDRPAFQMPCIFEYALAEVQQAVGDISAAMSTGKGYSRRNRLLLEVPTRGEFETDIYHNTLNEIQASMNALRRVTGELRVLLVKARKKFPPLYHIRFFLQRLISDETLDHMEFFLQRLIRSGVSRETIVSALNLMDQVDIERNAILKKLNHLLTTAHLRALPYITLSSEQLKRSEELEEGGGAGPQRWHDYYLRTHRTLKDFLKDG